MGYTWTYGELITATKLNNTGGGGTSGLVTDTSDELDKSYNDIIAMVTAGTLPFMILNGEVLYMSFIDNDETYEVDFVYPNGSTRNYVSSTADGTLVLD